MNPTTPRRLLGAASAAAQPPTPVRTTRDSYISESNFDTNMVIILAALLCALICALGLNAIARCALRCGRRLALRETPDQAAARRAARGLKKSRLRQIPVAVYGGSVGSVGAECPICLGEFVDGERVRVLPTCHHRFHVSCIDTWLLSHSSCPNCRHSLLGAEEESGKARPPESGPHGGDTDVAPREASSSV